VGGFFLSIVGQAPRGAGNDCIDYVKRVVGLPGDEIQMTGGILHINGEAVPTRRIEDFAEPNVALGNPPRRPRCINRPLDPGEPCLKEQYVETLPGGYRHRILNIEGEMGVAAAPSRFNADNTPVFTVPEGQLFFLGDNRDNSYDSRFPNQLGMVPFENLIGRADLIAFSSAGSLFEVWNWRFDRFFKSIE
jgi:signal peptidase I